MPAATKEEVDMEWMQMFAEYQFPLARPRHTDFLLLVLREEAHWA